MQFTNAQRAAWDNVFANAGLGRITRNALEGITAAGTGESSITVTEKSLGCYHKTKLAFTSLAVSTTDNGASGAIGSKKLITFPTGLIRILGARSEFTITAASGISATATVKHSLGIIPAATNDTLNLTKANIIPSTNSTLTSSAGTASGKSLATAITALTDNSGGTASNTIAAQTGSYVQATQQNTVASLAAKINEVIARLTLNGNELSPLVDGVSSAEDVYLNFGIADAGSSANSTLTITGYVVIDWVNLEQVATL